MTSSLITGLVTQYGYLGLYVSLLITILGIPLPAEFLLTFVGFLAFTGALHPGMAILVATLGSITGLTGSYLLGRFFERKVQGYLNKHTGSARLEKVLGWYNRHGGKLLAAGYFIPGFRNIFGYFAGLGRLRFREMALYGYGGALVWTATFVMLGYVMGSGWDKILPIFHKYSLVLGIGLTVLIVAFYLIYKNHERWGAALTPKIIRLSTEYKALGRRKFIITSGLLGFLALFILLMGIIQKFTFEEVGAFDEFVVSWLLISTPEAVTDMMQWFNALGTHLAIFIVFVVTTVLFYLYNKRWTQLLPLALAWGGGTLIDLLFRLIFRGENINIFENLTPFQAPSSGFMLAALSFYAVLGYLIAREASVVWQIIVLLGEIGFLGLVGFSPVYLHLHTPSAMVASITVGGLWAIVCVLAYEIRSYRLELGGTHE